ncbi:cytochrome P450 2A1-like [Paramacrobiotus metropolitanus]|uniref:cytochrome P450 2A1-like n=1 Tax=Paramacrobiotus metropolitanus TaxID=2943436 RepID=UPI0024462553|nr:cytochrome P450 2A1-like [Paramacrobiotus metropolitanus]
MVDKVTGAMESNTLTDSSLHSLGGVPFISLSVTAVILFFSWYYRKYRNVPPGPLGLPFVGYGPLLGSDPPAKMLKLKERYGKVMSMSFGPQLTIVLNNYEAVKEAFIKQGDKFIGRPSTFMFDLLTEKFRDGRVHGIGALEGEEWKQTRRFTLQTLRDLGMGKHAIQNRILEEAEHLAGVFQENVGKPFSATETLHGATCNVVSTLCFGQRFEYNDPEFRAVIHQLGIFAVLLAQAGPLQAYPMLRFLPGPLARTYAMWIDMQKKITDFTKNQMEKIRRIRSTDKDSIVPSYVDSFWEEKERLEESGSQLERSKIFQDLDLQINVQGLFGAGTETTATTLNWTFLFMLHHPDVQAKVHQEIDEQVGREHSITVDDRTKLPYLEAVCRESQRMGNVVPFGVIRCNTEETELFGYRIPDRSYVMANYKGINMDPTLWPEPEVFRPERFLNSKGQLEEPPYFMPFATGKRSCVGEALARMEIFLFFANILQRFELKPAKGQQLPPVDKYVTGISCQPLPFEMIIRRRD